MKNFANVLTELHAQTILTSPLGEDWKRGLNTQGQVGPMKSRSDCSEAVQKIREIRRETGQEVDLSKPSSLGFCHRQNQHLLRPHGGDHAPGGLPQTGNGFERELMQFFLHFKVFPCSQQRFPCKRRGGVNSTPHRAHFTHAKMFSCVTQGPGTHRFGVLSQKKSSPQAQIMFLAQSSLLDNTPRPFPHNAPSLLLSFAREVPTAIRTLVDGWGELPNRVTSQARETPTQTQRCTLKRGNRLTLNMPALGNRSGGMNLRTQQAPGDWSEVKTSKWAG